MIFTGYGYGKGYGKGDGKGDGHGVLATGLTGDGLIIAVMNKTLLRTTKVNCYLSVTPNGRNCAARR